MPRDPQSPIRLGVVNYLNSKPLAYGLEQRPQTRFTLRYDVPSKCAALLHENAIDLGLIPSIEYVRSPQYRIVPGIALASAGAVRSVALFTTRPVTAIRSVALDASSRTSVALLRVLCAQWFEIEPRFVTAPPDLPVMLRRADAALVIGDAALFADADAVNADKIDLGEEWTAMTNLPFVYAFWAGRAEVVTSADIEALARSKAEGLGHLDAIAEQYAGGDADRAAIGAEYLKTNMRYDLGQPEITALRRFFELSRELGVVPATQPARFYGDADSR